MHQKSVVIFTNQFGVVVEDFSYILFTEESSMLIEQNYERKKYLNCLPNLLTQYEDIIIYNEINLENSTRIDNIEIHYNCYSNEL